MPKGRPSCEPYKNIDTIIDICALRGELNRPCRDCIFQGSDCNKFISNVADKENQIINRPSEYKHVYKERKKISA